MEGVETRIVRTLSDAVSVLIEENFDGFVVEGETPIAISQATNARQHFPSLKILCLVSHRPQSDQLPLLEQQGIAFAIATRPQRHLEDDINAFVNALGQSSL